MSKETFDNPRVYFYSHCPSIRQREFERVLNVLACIYLQNIFEITGFGLRVWCLKVKEGPSGGCRFHRQEAKCPPSFPGRTSHVPSVLIKQV